MQSRDLSFMMTSRSSWSFNASTHITKPLSYINFSTHSKPLLTVGVIYAWRDWCECKSECIFTCYISHITGSCFYVKFPEIQEIVESGTLYIVSLLSVNSTKWSNTLKQIFGKFLMNCLSVFDHFVGLALKGLKKETSFYCFTSSLIFSIFYINITLYICDSRYYSSLNEHLVIRHCHPGSWEVCLFSLK